MKYQIKLIKTVIPIALLTFTSILISAQSKPDTVVITAANVNTSVLKPSNNRYLVYFKMAKDAPRSRPQFWTRNIKDTTYNGKAAILVSQEWEDRDTVVHRVQSICDKKTFAPLYHKSWWKMSPTGEFDFVNKTASIDGKALSDADTARNRIYPWNAFKVAYGQYVLNWHLDLEVFPILPYKAGKTFLIPFYDPGFPAPKLEAYTVTGSADLKGYDDQKIPCWLLMHESRGLKEIFWISKKTKEVLKLENEIGKDRWRYKIKLGFSV